MMVPRLLQLIAMAGVAGLAACSNTTTKSTTERQCIDTRSAAVDHQRAVQ